MESQNLFFHLMEEHTIKLVAARRQAQPDFATFTQVLLGIAVKLNFNPERFERQLQRV
jgi:hypothetical protein